jgi:PII-like signaling protein
MSNLYLTAFNNLVIKFNEDLISTFPDDNDFKVYKRGIEMLNSANAKKMCQLFKNYTHSYKNNIINKEETFFLTTDYNTVLNTIDKKEGIENIINKLKVCWIELSSTNKEKIWEYLISLIKLSDMIN